MALTPEQQEILKNKKVILTNRTTHFNSPLRYLKMLPLYDNYPPSFTYDQIFDASKAHALIAHLVDPDEIMGVLATSSRNIGKLVISTRSMGAVSPEMVRAYNELDTAGVLTVAQEGDYFQKILGCLVIAVTR